MATDFEGRPSLGDAQSKWLWQILTGKYVAPRIVIDNGSGTAISSFGGSGGTAMADDGAFTVGTSSFTPVGGTYRSVLDSVDDGDGGVFAMTAKRALMAMLVDVNGDAVSVGGGTQYAEDSAHASGHLTNLAGVIRMDTPGNLSNTDADYELLQVSAGRLWASAKIDTALPAGTNAIGKLAANSGVDIGDVDILSIAAGDNNIGNVDIASIAAGDNNIGNVDIASVNGFAAHDSGVAGNPLLMAGVASAAAPTSVSADQDVVTAWYLRNGAAATVITAAGALVGGDAANGLDVDVTRLPALAAGTNNIGDVDILSIAAGDNNIGNVDIASIAAGDNNIGNVDIVTLPALAAGTNAVGKLLPPDIDVTTNTNYAKKYYTNAGAVTDGIIWSPAAGKRWHIHMITIQVSAAATVTLEDDKAGGDEAIYKAEFAANSGVVLTFPEKYPWASGEDAADLIITTSAGNVYVTCSGFEI